MSAKVFDCFLFRDELELLELRLSYLWEVVDHFVIVSGSHSFQGEVLPDLLNPLPATLRKYSEKIHTFRCELPLEQIADSWKLEEIQRNSILDALQETTILDTDVVVLSDVDELWFSSIV